MTNTRKAPPVVEIDELTLSRNERRILDGITLRIPAGAVVGLVGRNGAGKSSLLRCLAGLSTPSRGASSLFGRPSLMLGDAECARLGYVAQTPDLFEWMTVADHLDAIGRAYPDWSRARCEALAAQLELPLQGKVAELSGGDKQKLSVVLAMGHDPDLLLLDEPVASLDPLTRRAFMGALFGAPFDEHPERERTVIISSHILSDLERVVSHVAFLRDGRLQLFDSWDALLEHVRRVPLLAQFPKEALVWASDFQRHVIIDTRRAPDLADHGDALTLDELFMELNA